MPVLSDPKADELSDEEVNKRFAGIARGETDRDYADIVKAEREAAKSKIPYKNGKGDDSNEPSGDEKPNANKGQSFRGKYKRPLIIAAAGGGAAFIGWSTIISGPMRLVQAAEMLKDFHFADDSEVTDSRVTKIWRYMRDPNNPENRRLGELSKRWANQTDAKFKSAGYEIDYKNGSGSFDKMKVAVDGDPQKTELAKRKLENLGLQEGRNFNVVGDNIEVELRGIRGQFQQGKLYKMVMTDIGYSKISTQVHARVLKKKAGVSYSVLGYLDDKVDDALKTAWETARKKRITNPDPPDVTITAGSQTDAEGEVREPTQAEIDASSDVDGDIVKGDRVQTKSRLRGSIRAGGALTAVVGIGCLAQNFAENIDGQQYENVNLPLIRSGMELIVIADQIKSGEGANLDEIGYHVEMLYGNSGAETENGEPAPKTAWTDAKDVQYENGDEQTGPEPPSALALNPTDNVFANIVATINSSGGATLDSVCSAASSTWGQVVTTGLDFAGGIVSGTVGTALSYLFADDVIDAIAGWASGEVLDLNASGATYGSYVNQGARLAANEQAIANGGRALSTTEVAELRTIENENQRMIAQEQSWQYRYFSKDNHRSVVSTIGRAFPNSQTEAVRNFAKSPLSILSSMKMLFPGAQAYAQSNNDYQYETPNHGFSAAEIDDEGFENPFQNARVLEPQIDSLNEEYGERCFGVRMDDAAGSIEFFPGKSDSKLREDCPELFDADPGTTFKRYRYYILDTMTMMSMACYEGDDKVCQELGFGNETQVAPTTPTGGSGSGDPGQDTSAMACPTGTDDGGIQQDYGPGGVPTVRIKICGIPGAIPPSRGVNASIAAQTLQMFEAMRAAGLNPSGNAFRSYERQQELRESNCPDPVNSPSGACSPPTAKPGTSMHEVGLAIDFENMCYPRATCTPGSNTRYDWLTANAQNFGFTKLNSEAWHWGTTGN